MHAPIIAEPEVWQEITAAVNRWRGHCVSTLARGEVAVTETLLALAAHDTLHDTVALPHLFGQKMQALADCLPVDGPFHAEGKRAADALEAFRKHGELRTFLCHAPGTIARDRAGRWLFVLETLAIRSAREERATLVITEAQSVVTLAQLSADCQRLCTRLRTLREAFGVAVPT